MFKMQVLVIPRLQPNQHLFCTHLRAKVCIVCSATCLNCYNVFFCWYLSIFCVFSNRFQHLFGTRLLKLKKKSKKHLWKPLRKNTHIISLSLFMDLSESLALACPCFIWHLLCYGSLLRNSFFHHHPQSFAQRTVPGWPCALSRPPAPCASPILLQPGWNRSPGENLGQLKDSYLKIFSGWGVTMRNLMNMTILRISIMALDGIRVLEDIFSSYN